MFIMMQLNRKLTTKHLILSQILILIIGLTFLGTLYFILNIQYQKPKNLFLVGPVTTLPKSLLLDLGTPDQDTLSFSSSIIVSGKTGPKKDVLISTDTRDLVIQSKADGSFSTVLNLDEGVNTIKVVVFDTTGEARSAERTVYFSKEKI